MTRGIFVTGTDTGVGKTLVATALLRALVAGGARAVGMKPVAAGIAPGAAVSGDVEAILAAGNVDASQSDVNPYSFASAIAPHLAAAKDGVAIDLDVIAASYGRLVACADIVVVEGAGGVLAPLCGCADMLDVPARLGIPVVLVVGMRLGCINHALLSTLAINARGLRLAGWVANRIDPAMDDIDANVATLALRLPAPLAVDIAWRADGAPPLRLHGASLRALDLGRDA